MVYETIIKYYDTIKTSAVFVLLGTDIFLIGKNMIYIITFIQSVY